MSGSTSAKNRRRKAGGGARAATAGGSDSRSSKRLVRWLSATLETEYGIPKPQSRSSPLEILIETILSQNTNDANRDAAFRRLKSSFPSWESLGKARLSRIETAIKPAGLFRQKSRSIKGLLRYLKKEHGGLDGGFICGMSSREAIEELTALKGVGIKTVSIVLMFGCDRDDIFPVDTHVLRVSKRLGLLPESTSAEKAHLILGDLVPPGEGKALHLNMVRFGREMCRARMPMCKVCFLASRCPWPERNPGRFGPRGG